LPKVLLVVLDDTGFGHLGCYGSPIATPNFDALAADGVRYNNMHTTALCSTSSGCRCRKLGVRRRPAGMSVRWADHDGGFASGVSDRLSAGRWASAVGSFGCGEGARDPAAAHQLAVLQRQAGRPGLTWADRAVIAALALRVPPGDASDASPSDLRRHDPMSTPCHQDATRRPVHEVDRSMRSGGERGRAGAARITGVRSCSRGCLRSMRRRAGEPSPLS